MDTQHPNPVHDSDHRYFPRWNASNLIFYTSEDNPQSREGYTKDLSCAGASIYVREPLSRSQKLKITIQLSPRINIDVQATVLWQKKDESPHLTGVAFFETSDTTQDLILRYAFEIDRERLIRHWFYGWEGR